MKRLILLSRIEWIKFQRPATLFWLLGLLVVLMGLSFFSAGPAVTGNEADSAHLILESLVSNGFSLGGMFVAIWLILSQGKEYSHNTIRKRLINGYSREELLESALIQILMLILATLVILVVAYIFLLALLGASPFQKEVYMRWHLLAFIIPYLLLSASEALLVVTLVKKTGISILILLGWKVVEQVIFLINQYMTFTYEWPEIVSYVLPGLIRQSIKISPDQMLEWQGMIGYMSIIILLFSASYFKLKRSDY